MSDAVDWIETLDLKPHPEGGYFRRIYESPARVDMPRESRHLATSIYYLLDREEPMGRLHRNRSDILHFLLEGGPIEYVLLTAAGELQRQQLSAGNRFLLVPGGCWKASRLIEGASLGLISEVVTPGFDYADHEFATEEILRGEHAAHWPVLEAFVRRPASLPPGD